MITQFSQEVINKINFYVYKLIDPRNGHIFYVGKGTGNRIFNHIKCAIDFYDGVDELTDDDPNKLRIIKEIMNEGLEVIPIIQRWNLTEKEAFEVEAALIDVYQGLTNKQVGHHTEFGVINAESLQRRLSLKEYSEPTNFKYIIIKVRDWRLDELFPEFPLTYRYEATRYAWKIKPKNIQQYPYVFSVTNGIVKEVYKIKEWYFVEDRNRYAFNGDVADHNIRDKFVNKRVPSEYVKKGMASPVLFSKNKVFTENNED